MRPSALTYRRASSVDAAVQLLAAGDATPIAGGQGVMRDLRNRTLDVSVVVDLGRVAELDYVRLDADVLEVGAVTRIAHLASDPAVASACPALGAAAGRVGDVQIRNRGTVGGNICGSWLPSVWSNDVGVVLLASGGDVVVQAGSGSRTVPAAEFLGSPTNPLAPHEFIRALRFPLWPRSAYERLSRRYADASIGSVAAFARDGGSGPLEVGLAAGRISALPVALPETAAAIAQDGEVTAAALAALDAEIRTLEVVGNVQADADYRRHVLPVLVRRAVDTALTHGGSR